MISLWCQEGYVHHGKLKLKRIPRVSGAREFPQTLVYVLKKIHFVMPNFITNECKKFK